MWVPHGGELILSRLKDGATRGHAYEELKMLLGNGDLSSLWDSENIYNSIAYIASHSKLFSERQAFTIIDLALSDASTKERQKETIRSLANKMSTSESSRLSLFPNLKEAGSCQGTYIRLMDLLSSSKPLRQHNCELFNAMATIASRIELFTDEQHTTIVDCALTNDSFTEQQRSRLRLCKADRSALTSSRNPKSQSPTFASVVSGTGSCEPSVHLKVPKYCQKTSKNLVQASCGRPPELSNSELFDYIGFVAFESQNVTSTQFAELAEWAIQHSALTEEQKILVRLWGEKKSLALAEVAPCVRTDSAMKKGLIPRPSDPSIKASSRLFSKLKDPSKSQEAYTEVLNLMRHSGGLENYKSTLYNAISIIGSRQEHFTHGQFYAVVASAMSNKAFTDVQRAHFEAWKKDRRKSFNPKQERTCKHRKVATILCGRDECSCAKYRFLR